MKKYLFSKISFILVMSVFMTMTSCEKDNESDSGMKDSTLRGYVQKGQLIKGSTLTAFSLNQDMASTGESFPSSIKDDLGSFNLSMTSHAPFYELKAEGYYFNENTGEISKSPIYLSALVSSNQKDVNVNVLTTLTNGRIKKLIGEGKSFEEAKKEAENSLLKEFSIKLSSSLSGFETLNIAKDGQANAILLAASCLIQEGRSAGEIQQLISELASDFEEDGSLTNESIEEIISQKNYVAIIDIINNLIEFYVQKGIENFEIPPFYSIINEEYATGFHVLYDIITSGEFDTDIQGGTKEFYAISYEEFVAESDVEWITTNIVKLCNNIYKITCDIAANSEPMPREGNVHIKSSTGDILYTNVTKQRGNGQRIYLQFPSSGTRSIYYANEGNGKVNINGVDYDLKLDSERNMKYVDIPKSEKGYGISTLPEMIVSAEDVLCAKISYKNEIDEFTMHSENIDGREAPNSNMPYYAALKAMSGYALPNPAEAKLELACSLLSLQINDGTSNSGVPFDKLIVEINEDGCLSGNVTSCQYPDQSLFDPSYKTPETVYENRSNKVTIRNTNNDNKVSFLVHPQVISKMKCTGYDASGNVLFTIENKIDFDLQKGKNYLLNMSIKNK